MICKRCGYIFESGSAEAKVGELLVVGRNIDLASPEHCPRCQTSDEPVPVHFRQVLELLETQTHSLDEIVKLLDLLNGSVKTQQPPSELAETIESKAVHYKDLRSLLPRTRGDLYQFVASVAAVLTLLVTVAPGVTDDVKKALQGAGSELSSDLFTNEEVY